MYVFGNDIRHKLTGKFLPERGATLYDASMQFGVEPASGQLDTIRDREEI